MSETGIIFDIKQFAIFDGPGIRTTVFFKGCPLRCMWCHNPEGLSFQPQLMVSNNGCLNCGKCKAVCTSPENCILCGDCVKVCPLHLRKICGEEITGEQLAKRILKDKEYLLAQGGGVTFSGGEPTGQPAFLIETLERLKSIHRAIETSGYCQVDTFKTILTNLDYVIMDIKLVDEKKHRHYTGLSNQLILKNLEEVKKSGKPFLIRIPVIPGVNDTDENFEQTAKLLVGVTTLEQVELLPYHKTAGAKYSMVGRKYKPQFNEEIEPNLNVDIFHKHGIACTKM